MRVLVIGGIVIDIEGSPNHKLLYHDSNLGKIKIKSGGVGRNIAENMCKLGVDTSMLSYIGNDEMGHAAVDGLIAMGVDTSHIFVAPDKRTAMYLSILNHENDMELALNDMEVIKEITIDLLKEHMEYIRSFDIILLDANLEEEVLVYLCENLKDKKIVCDTVSAAKAVRVKSILKYLYAIKPNALEAEILTGLEIEGEEGVMLAGKKLLELGVKKAFITLNKDGVYYIDENDSGFLRPRENLKILSATGAGDSFTASIIMGLTEGRPVKEIAKLGMAAAEITMESADSVSGFMNRESVLERGKLNDR